MDHISRYRAGYTALLAFVVGVGLNFVIYPISADAKIGGFPLPAYGFERTPDGQWLDFVGGGVTLLMMLGNFAIGCFIVIKTVILIENRIEENENQVDK